MRTVSRRQQGASWGVGNNLLFDLEVITMYSHGENHRSVRTFLQIIYVNKKFILILGQAWEAMRWRSLSTSS